MDEFKKELEQLINTYCVENEVDMPDFLLAEMVCNFIQTVGVSVKKNLDWHGCDSVCHPNKGTEKLTPIPHNKQINATQPAREDLS